MENDNKVCRRCVMDTTDPDIQFDQNGICHYCNEAEVLLSNIQNIAGTQNNNIQYIIDNIKDNGKRKRYDSIIGLSGGVDSSYVAYLAKQYGLKPLAIHFDNGWNTDIAVSNIKNITDILDFDLISVVIDWREFRDLQRSFFKASVVDIEMLTDHAIFASMFKIAKKFNIRYVLSGTNLATEFGLPEAWIWNKLDLKNIKGIQNIFGTMKIKQFPSMSIYRWLLIRKLGLGGEFIEILNHVNYKKYKAINILKSELGWREYGDKHYESLFTKFYQAYILPEKFGIDKRKFHLSALIRNNEISRKKSLELLQMPLYNSQEFIDDKNYVLKKLGFTDSEFKVYMESPEIPHSFYPSSIEFLRFVRKIFKKVKKVGN